MILYHFYCIVQSNITENQKRINKKHMLNGVHCYITKLRARISYTIESMSHFSSSSMVRSAKTNKKNYNKHNNEYNIKYYVCEMRCGRKWLHGAYRGLLPYGAGLFYFCFLYRFGSKAFLMRVQIFETSHTWNPELGCSFRCGLTIL